jgi:hypothetical protein
MHLISSKDLHYLINQALLDKDGITWYKAIVELVHGTTNCHACINHIAYLIV